MPSMEENIGGSNMQSKQRKTHHKTTVIEAYYLWGFNVLAGAFLQEPISRNAITML